MNGLSQNNKTLNGLYSGYYSNITLTSEDTDNNKVLITDNDNTITSSSITKTELETLNDIDTDETIQYQLNQKGDLTNVFQISNNLNEGNSTNIRSNLGLSDVSLWSSSNINTFQNDLKINNSSNDALLKLISTTNYKSKIQLVNNFGTSNIQLNDYGHTTIFQSFGSIRLNRTNTGGSIDLKTNNTDRIKIYDTYNDILNTLRLSYLSNSLPLKIDSNKDVISGTINFSELTNTETTLSGSSNVICDSSGIKTYIDNQTSGNYLQINNNLSDLSNTTTARNNLGLGSMSLRNDVIYSNLDPDMIETTLVGGTSSLVRADTIKNYTDSNFLKISNNLSDLSNTTTARTNLGLGSMSLINDVIYSNLDPDMIETTLVGGTSSLVRADAIKNYVDNHSGLSKWTKTGGIIQNEDITNVVVSRSDNNNSRIQIKNSYSSSNKYCYLEVGTKADGSWGSYISRQANKDSGEMKIQNNGNIRIDTDTGNIILNAKTTIHMIVDDHNIFLIKTNGGQNVARFQDNEGLLLYNLSINKPVKTTSSGYLTTDNINLSDTNEIEGILSVSNGGTGVSSIGNLTYENKSSNIDFTGEIGGTKLTIQFSHNNNNINSNRFMKIGDVVCSNYVGFIATHSGSIIGISWNPFKVDTTGTFTAYSKINGVNKLYVDCLMGTTGNWNKVGFFNTASRGTYTFNAGDVITMWIGVESGQIDKMVGNITIVYN